MEDKERKAQQEAEDRRRKEEEQNRLEQERRTRQLSGLAEEKEPVRV